MQIFKPFLKFSPYDFVMLKGRFRTLVLWAFAVILSAGLLVGGYLGYKTYAAAAKVAKTSNPIKLVSSFTRSSLDSTDGITNILIAGNSADDAGHSGAKLTDSIMIVRINQATKKVTLISVPRDLWVDIPGYGYHKINAAYPYGGMSLLEEVVEDNLGIHCHYGLLVDYAALKEAVDAVGGIDVTIASSDSRGIYDSSKDYTTGGVLVNLTNGTHHLNGQQALNLARARGSGYGSYGYSQSDFTRTQYQQQILLALFRKASSTSVIANPLAAGKIISSLGGNISTDLTLGQMETLYSDYKGSSAAITQITLNNVNGQNLLASYTSSDGQSALIPAAGLDNFTTIQTTLAAIIAESDTSSTTAS
jgi:LCP family protein required for cell wall assembly